MNTLTQTTATNEIVERIIYELDCSNLKCLRYNPKIKKWQARFIKGKQMNFKTFWDMYLFLSTDGAD